jgi:hypothetical protein
VGLIVLPSTKATFDYIGGEGTVAVYITWTIPFVFAIPALFV